MEASRQATSMFERSEFGGKRSGGPENDPMTHRLNAGDKHAACCQAAKWHRRREQPAGHEKKKHAVGKDRRRGGHEVPRGFEPRPLESESSVLTVTPRDQLMEVTGRVT